MVEDMGESQGKGNTLLMRVVDALEMVNAEWHGLCTKLAGIHQALEYLTKYLTKVAYHHYVDGSEVLVCKQGKEVGLVVEAWRLSVRSSEAQVAAWGSGW